MNLSAPSVRFLAAAIFLPCSLPVVLAQSSINNSGFNDGDNVSRSHHESWLKRNWQLFLIIIATLLVMVLLTWYIVRSVKDMRKRLVLANEKDVRELKEYDQLLFQQSTTVGKHQQSGSPPPEYTHRY